ncbi:hypothetical protein ACQKII_24340 [Lysinibacillus sp. NPDC048646]|uniref:hypothetical protein n=1 Tax=Lysinibacillus sp. NPDC048646 TaxID=3390574 RepID=UPI003D06BBED
MASYTKHGNTWQYNISRVVDGKQKQFLNSGGFKTKKEYGSSFTNREVLVCFMYRSDLVTHHLDITTSTVHTS